MVVVAIRDLADAELEGEADCHWLYLGELDSLLRVFREQQVRRCVMVGKVPKTFLYERGRRLHPDARALRFLGDLADDRGVGSACLWCDGGRRQDRLGLLAEGDHGGQRFGRGLGDRPGGIAYLARAHPRRRRELDDEPEVRTTRLCSIGRELDLEAEIGRAHV